MSKVKICGLCRAEDIAAVNIALPDYVGFVFACSRRRVDKRTAAELRKRLDHRIKTVGVFVNNDAELISRLFRDGVINLAQLHGDEDENYIKSLKKSCNCPVIKAIGVGTTLPALPKNTDYLLFDTLSVQRGGTGESFDWSLLKGVALSQFFLAGGLTVWNVSEAISTLTPYCVDVSSGVETDGIKDADKIYEFVRAVRESGKKQRHSSNLIF